jgi:hypothetical protein
MSRSCLNGNVKLLPDELCHCQHVVVAGVGAIYAATNGRYDQPSMTRSRATNADTNETVSHPRQYDGHRTLDGGWVIRESWIKVWGRSYNKSGDVEKRLLFTLNYMERGEGAHHENVFFVSTRWEKPALSFENSMRKAGFRPLKYEKVISPQKIEQRFPC